MEYLLETARGFWETTLAMAPYLLFGFFVAGLLSVVISADKVEKHLGGRGLMPIMKASLFGVPLPLCSCGVIPVAASLRRHGANKGSTTAFLLSTPQTGVDSIMVTLSLLGPVFAIFRPIAAFVTGLLGGVVVEAVDREDDEGTEPEHCADECCESEGRRATLARILHHGFVTLPRDIAKPLFIGLIIAGVISGIAPPQFFSDTVGTGIVAMLVMMALGIPLYVCATASVPIAAAMWLQGGATPGAILVFLMTGPATNAATITTIWKMMGRRVAIAYLAVVATTALGSGLLLDYVFRVAEIEAGSTSMTMLPPWLKILSATVLFAVLGAAMLRRKKPGNDTKKPESCCEQEQHACCENR